MKQMGVLSNVPIIPSSSFSVVNKCLEIPGVLIASVPGGTNL
jgi:hypothetical protein